MSRLEKGFVGFIFFTAVIIFEWMGRYLSSGFDLTDEGFYLSWVANPFNGNVWVSQFGFIYHPIYRMFNGHLGYLRAFNLGFTFLLGWIVTHFFFKTVLGSTGSSRFLNQAVVLGFSMSSLVIFDSWLITPNYNTLAFQALLIATMGIILIENDQKRGRWIGPILLGVGGWLTFMAKPSSALALAVLTLFYLVLGRRIRLGILAVSGLTAVSLLVLSAFIIDGSIFLFINRIKTAIEFGGLLDAGHSLGVILRVDKLALNTEGRIVILISAFWGALMTWLWSTEDKKKIWLCALMGVACLALVSLHSLEVIVQGIGFDRGSQRLGLWGVVMVIIGWAYRCVRQSKRPMKEMEKRQWAFVGFLIFVPYIFAFGTTNNYWQTGASASLFWILGSLNVLSVSVNEMQRKKMISFVLPLALICQVLTATLLLRGFEKPYRQAKPLREQTEPLFLAGSNSRVKVSEEAARYMRRFKNLMERSDFRAGTPFIDLSGHSPWLSLILKSEPTGHVWTLGGYPGSQRYLEAGLAVTPCQKLAQSWLLVEPGGPRSISAESLRVFGGFWPEDYEQVGLLQTPSGLSEESEVYDQIIYKPKSVEALVAVCEEKRSKLTHSAL